MKLKIHRAQQIIILPTQIQMLSTSITQISKPIFYY